MKSENVNEMSKRKTNKIVDLRKKLLKYNHLKDNRLLYKLRTLTKEEVFRFLASRGFLKEATLFYEESVDGPSYIFLMTRSEGLEYLNDLFRFTKKQLNDLLDLYLFILRFRQIHCKDFSLEEFPQYITYSNI